MNKFVLISDMHLSVDNPRARLDDCKEAGYRKLQYVLDWAEKNRAGILHAGDLSHKPRSWHLLSDLQHIFLINEPFYTIYGQHDTVMYNEQTRKATILGALAGAGFVKILGFDPKNIEGYDIYGCHYGQEPPVLNNSGNNILVIHKAICDESLWSGQDYLDAKTYLAQHKNYRIILCGDIHKKFHIQIGDRHIVNAGPMIRREANIYNYKHCPGFWVWDIDDENMNWQEIPHDLAEKVLSRDHIDYKEEADSILDQFISSVKTDIVSGDVSFMDNLWKFIKDNKIEESIVEKISQVIGEEFYGK